MDYTHRPDNFEELQQWIEQAFADAVYPGDHTIATNPHHCEECQETDAFFRGRHWRELAQSGEKLQFGWGGLSFLSPLAWRFFMPTYLLVGLGESEYASEVSSSALFALSPPQSANLEEYFQERASGFSLSQQECIAAYVSAFSEMEPDYTLYATTARYWREKAAEMQTEPEQAPHIKRWAKQGLSAKEMARRLGGDRNVALQLIKQVLGDDYIKPKWRL